jgi:hypothetical protein
MAVALLELNMASSFVSRMMTAGAAGLFVLAAAHNAHADEPAFQRQPYQGPQYTAPLYQQTQPSYVPQSVALSGPREIKDWNEGEAIPPGYRPVERTRKGLIVGGAVTFGTLYLISALAASAGADSSKYSGGSNPLAAMWIPALGPFIQMGSTESSTGKLFLAIDGAAQTAGAAMLIAGLVSPKTVLVRNDLAEVRVTPMVAKGTAGAGLTGTF